MKMTKRILVLMLTVMLMFSAVSPAFAQVAPPEATAKAGETIDVEFKYEGIAGINGTFTYSNSDLFADIDVDISGLDGVYNPDNGMIFCSNLAGKIVDVVITFTLTIADDAVKGDTCTITLEYEIPDSNGQLPTNPEWKYDSVTITVGSSVDYKELNRQIDIAEGLNELDYTEKSWNDSDIEALLQSAIDARSSDSQDVVDSAAKALEDAINALVKMNYSELKKQINKAIRLIKRGQGNNSDATWNAMTTAYDAAVAVTDCRDQDKVDAAANALADAIEALKEIDYTELNNQIAIAEGLNELDYTKKSWDSSNIATLLAKAVEARNSKVQVDVDAAANALADAIASLVLMNEDELDKQIAIAEGLVEAGQGAYSDVSWNAMINALAAAKAAKGCRDQDKVDAAANALADAIAALKEIDYTELNKQIAIAEGLNELDYTKKSWDNSNIATLLAKAVEARNSKVQVDVDAAANALADAIASLVLMNEEELNKQIGIANGLVEAGQGTYTNKSWKAMTDALEIAKAAVGCRNQETVDAVAKALAEAINALEKVDYTALKEQIAIAESLEKDKYTEESWKNLENALAAAKEALNSRDQETVNAATIALKNAIAALEIPPTGDTMIIFVALAALAAIAMAVLLVIKNKKRSIVK